MSNQDHSSRRVISIKQLSDIYPLQRNQTTPNSVEKGQKASSMEEKQVQEQISELNNQKKTILQDLRATIEAEKNAWQEQKEKERNEAREKGYQAGFQSGREEAQSEWQTELEKVNNLADQAKEEYYRTIEKHEDAIIELAMTSAEKIVHHELKEKKNAFAVIIQEAIKDMEDSSYIRIYVHPDEYEHVVNLKAELEQVVGAKELITIYADPELARFGCVIRHPNGQIDASIDLQLKEIKNTLVKKVMGDS